MEVTITIPTELELEAKALLKEMQAEDKTITSGQVLAQRIIVDTLKSRILTREADAFIAQRREELNGIE